MLNGVNFNPPDSQAVVFKNNAPEGGTAITLLNDPVMNLPEGVAVDANNCAQGTVLSGQQSCEIILSANVDAKDTSTDKKITFEYSTGENTHAVTAQVSIFPVNVAFEHEDVL